MIRLVNVTDFTLLKSVSAYLWISIFPYYNQNSPTYYKHDCTFNFNLVQSRHKNYYNFK